MNVQRYGIKKGKIYEKYKVPTPFQDGKVEDNGDEITPYTVKTEDVLSCGEDRVWRVSMCAYF